MRGFSKGFFFFAGIGNPYRMIGMGNRRFEITLFA